MTITENAPERDIDPARWPDVATVRALTGAGRCSPAHLPARGCAVAAARRGARRSLLRRRHRR